MNNKPLVAIRCATYNHKPYIRQCLDGFTMQKTNFPFIAIVIDDASTDNEQVVLWDFINIELEPTSLQKEETEDFVRVVAPHKTNHNCTFVFLFLKYNHYSIKKTKAPYIEEWSDIKYTSLCEGDDYWTDPNKLQRETDFLENHTDYVAVAENALVINSIKNSEYLFSKDASRDVTIKEMIIKRRFTTASVVYRAYLVAKMSSVTQFAYDTMTWCYLCCQGKFRYENIVSSVYRRGMQGVTESTDKYKWAKIVESWNLELKRLFYPKYVEDNIIILNIWNQYKIAFEKGRGNTKLKSIFKMFQYRKLSTFKYLLKKLYVHFKSV